MEGVDPSLQARTAAAVKRRGVKVTVQRLTGFAPNVVTVSAEIVAALRTVAPDTTAVSDTGYSASKPGAISQEDRQATVMAADLARKGFPLPLAKNDKVIVEMTQEKFNITRVDPYTRAVAGAIDFTMTGVS